MPGTPIPQGLVVTAHEFYPSVPEFDVLVEWDPNPGAWELLELQGRPSGGTWATIDAAILGVNTEYWYESAPYDQRTEYRIRGYAEETGWSNFSQVTSFAIWLSQASDTVSAGETLAISGDGADWSDISDTATASDLVTDAPTYYESISDTATITDLVQDVVIERLEVGRFLGSDNGKLFLYDASYHGDNTMTMPAWWESKDIDMDDQYPQFMGKYKYLHGVKLRFIDLDEHQVTIQVSTDGGTTWVSNTKTLGDGSGGPEEKIFNFWIHGRTFMVRVSHSSADKDFQWVDLELMFEPAGDYFEVA